LGAGCLLLLTSTAVTGQVSAFPGAEGFGAMATGGRGGKVIQVTNLNDAGTGSFRSAAESSGARTIVFRVSGTIALQSSLNISSGNVTIAGQTAPGDGICIRNYPLKVSADNVIIRFIRARMGDVTATEDDAMNGRYHKNIILDHCSMSWSTDECASFYDNQNFTMQYCILSESLYASVHDKGNHGYGGIWGGQGATFHHNLLAHHTSRNPRFCGSRYTNHPELEKIDHRNNVIYNWGFNSCYGAEGGSYNIVSNYYKYGPATVSSIKDRIIHPDPDNGENSQPAGVRGQYYVAGNYVYGYPATTEDNWLGVDGIASSVREEIELTEPVDAPALTNQSAQEAFEYVIAEAGAVLPRRDALDIRYIHETVTGTASFGGAYCTSCGIIDTQETVGGWPALESAEAPADTDSDGIPDEWEDLNGLDKTDPADRNNDMKGEGYTNLEYYLNSLVEAFEYLLRPVEFRVDTITGYAVSLAWEDISDNETGFVIERNEGQGWNVLTELPAGDTAYTDGSISANGIYYYRMKTVNDALESFYTDSVTADLHVGIVPFDGGPSRLKVVPNPVTGEALISFTLAELAPVNLTLLDLAGKEVLRTGMGLQPAGEGQAKLATDGLTPGVYLLRLSAGYDHFMEKIIIAE
jgi:pectate lyase